MTTIKCTYRAAGVVGVNSRNAFDTVTTEISCSFEEAKKYFLGHVFNLGMWYDSQGNEKEDNMMRCISISQL